MAITLVFDLDDTIYNLMDSFAKTHEELFKDRTEATSEELFLASRKYNKEAFDMYNKGILNKKEEFAYRIRNSYKQYGTILTEEEIEAFEQKYRYYQKHLEVPMEMVEILNRLKEEKISLGLLTNGNHIDQWDKIIALKMNRWIPEINTFVSEDLPKPKPEKEAFEEVEKMMGINKDEAWYIGDTFEADIIGAANAGWHSIWFNHRHREKEDENVISDYEVYSYKELKDVLYKICGM